MAEIYPRNKAPCVRTFREHMDRGGHILQVGRSCYTTRASLNAYKQELQSCVDSGRSSRQSGAKRRMAPIYWAARGFVPVKRPDGTFARRRVELSLGGNTATARQEEVDRLNAAYEERALHDPLTFSRAYMNHIEHHAVPLYAEEILASLGERQCREINDTVMVELSRTLFGPHAKASYVNRHLYTPVLAILRMALKERAPQLARPKGHKESPAVAIPEKTWFKAVLPHMDTTTRALVSFHHARPPIGRRARAQAV